MHIASKSRMQMNIDEYLPFEPMVVADLGSLDVNGSYRELVEPVRTYVGIDVVEGNNVDLVMPSHYDVPVEDNYFDALISGQCFEHVLNPFKLMREVSRVVCSGGFVLMVAPFLFPEHRYPVDCWRFLGDGWRSLMDDSGIDVVITEYIDAHKGYVDSWVIGRIP